MQNVLRQAELLAEAILSSEEYKQMKLSEQAAMKDEEATKLVALYSEKHHAVEEMLSNPDLERGALQLAGEELKKVEMALDKNAAIAAVRANSEAFEEMMKKVNAIIHYMVTGEEEHEEGCTGSCEACGGCGHHH